MSRELEFQTAAPVPETMSKDVAAWTRFHCYNNLKEFYHRHIQDSFDCSYHTFTMVLSGERPITDRLEGLSDALRRITGDGYRYFLDTYSRAYGDVCKDILKNGHSDERCRRLYKYWAGLLRTISRGSSVPFDLPGVPEVGPRMSLAEITQKYEGKIPKLAMEGIKRWYDKDTYLTVWVDTGDYDEVKDVIAATSYDGKTFFLRQDRETCPPVEYPTWANRRLTVTGTWLVTDLVFIGFGASDWPEHKAWPPSADIIADENSHKISDAERDEILNSFTD